MRSRVLRLTCRLYALMLRAYPSAFRREYSREMMLVFEARSRDVVEHGGSWAMLPFMAQIARDWSWTIRLRVSTRARLAASWSNEDAPRIQLVGKASYWARE